MLITIGSKTIHTAHVSRIDWGASRSMYVPTADGTDINTQDFACVLVFYAGDNGGYDEFMWRDAAILATWFKDATTNLNLMTPDADFLHKYPEPPADADEVDCPF